MPSSIDIYETSFKFSSNNLDNIECKNIIGDKGKVIRGKFKAGLVYVNGRWHMGGYKVPIRR